MKQIKPAFSGPATLLLMAATAPMWACDGPLDPGDERALGIIAFHGDPVVLTVPDSVRVGDAFEVSIRTYGDGCYRMGDTEVGANGLLAEVAPYDSHATKGVCAAILRSFDHRGTLTFGQSGTARVTFRGMQVPENRPISVSRDIVVLAPFSAS